METCPECHHSPLALCQGGLNCWGVHPTAWNWVKCITSIYSFNGAYVMYYMHYSLLMECMWYISVDYIIVQFIRMCVCIWVWVAEVGEPALSFFVSDTANQSTSPPASSASSFLQSATIWTRLKLVCTEVSFVLKKFSEVTARWRWHWCGSFFQPLLRFPPCHTRCRRSRQASVGSVQVSLTCDASNVSFRLRCLL